MMEHFNIDYENSVPWINRKTDSEPSSPAKLKSGSKASLQYKKIKIADKRCNSQVVQSKKEIKNTPPKEVHHH